MANATIPQAPVADNEMKLKLKYRTKKPGNKAVSKKNNSGATGRKAKSAKRAVVVSSRNSPEQYGRWKAMMVSNKEPVLG